VLSRLKKRVESRAEQVLFATLDKTAAAVETAVETGARVKALTNDPNGQIDVESMMLIFVDTVRGERENGRPASRADVIRAYRGRQRLMKWMSRLGPWGIAAGRLSTLYSEAAILCDVADAGKLGLSREELAAHVLVLWDVLPDFEQASAAMRGEEGQSVTAQLKRRIRGDRDLDEPAPMTKIRVVQLLWKLRSVRKGLSRSGIDGVEEMVDEAEEQLRSAHRSSAACNPESGVSDLAIQPTLAATHPRADHDE